MPPPAAIVPAAAEVTVAPSPAEDAASIERRRQEERATLGATIAAFHGKLVVGARQCERLGRTQLAIRATQAEAATHRAAADALAAAHRRRVTELRAELAALAAHAAKTNAYEINWLRDRIAAAALDQETHRAEVTRLEDEVERARPKAIDDPTHPKLVLAALQRQLDDVDARAEAEGVSQAKQLAALQESVRGDEEAAADARFELAHARLRYESIDSAQAIANTRLGFCAKQDF